MARGTWEGSGTWKTTGGGSGGLVLVVAVVILAASGAASAAVTAMEVILIAIACLAVAAVLGGIALLIWRARSDRPGAAFRKVRTLQIPPESQPVLSSEHKTAIEPPREIHLHLNVSPGQLAAIMQRYADEK